MFVSSIDKSRSLLHIRVQMASNDKGMPCLMLAPPNGLNSTMPLQPLTWGQKWIQQVSNISWGLPVSRPPLWSSGQSFWLLIQTLGFDSRRYQIFWEVVGVDRSPLSLVSTVEELLERKSSGSGLENRDYARKGYGGLTTRHPSIRKRWH
jgi:hypothetical protein